MLGTVALVVLSLGLGLIVIHTDWGRERIRRIVEAQLRDVFPGGARVGKIEGSLVGDFSVLGIELADVTGAKLVRIGSLRGNVALRALIEKTIRLDELVVDDVELYAPRTPFPPRDEEPLDWRVELPDIRVHRARIVIEAAEPVTLDDVELTASLVMVRPTEMLAKVLAHAHVRGRWRERGLPIEATVRLVAGEAIEIPLVTASVGDVRIAGAHLVVEGAGERVRGFVTASATPAGIAALVPGLVLPAPVSAAVVLTGAGPETQAELFATLGEVSVRGSLLADLQARGVRGIVSARGLDATTVAPELTGRGDAVIAIVADLARARGTAMVRVTAADLPVTHALVGFEATLDLQAGAGWLVGARALALAAGGGGLGLAATGELRRTGDRLEIAGSRVVATVQDAFVASAGRVALTGRLQLDAELHGTLAPALGLELAGSIVGSRLRSGELRIAGLSGTLEGRVIAAGITGGAHVRAGGISRGGVALGSIVVDARHRLDGTIVAHVAGRAAAAPVTIDLDATVTPPRRGGATQIVLGDHRVRTPRGTWSGRGGRITVTDTLATVTGVGSTSGDARVAVDASYAFTSETMTLSAEVSRLAMTLLDPAYRGTASGRVAIKRRGLRWDGSATLTGAGLALAADGPAIDGEVELAVVGRHVTVDAKATTWQLGGVRLLLDIDGPRDLTDLAAWQRLERSAVRSALLGLTRIDLAAAAVSTGGILDGELLLSGAETGGTLSIKAVRSPLGVVDGEITFAAMDQGELGASSTLRINGFGNADVAARIAFPHRPFDPAAWQQLGRGVLRVLTVSLEDVAVDPARLAALGITAPYRGRADVSLAVAAGAGQAKAIVDLRQVSGGVLVRPIDVRIEGSIGDATTAAVQVRRARPPAERGEWPEDDPAVLARLTAQLPVSFDRLLATPDAARHAPVTGTVVIPEAELPGLLALFGRTEVRGGRLAGAITVGGKVDDLTAKGEIIATNIDVKPRLPGRKIPRLTELRISGSWAAGAGVLEVTGREANGATLAISARGRPDRRAAAVATVDIVKFDIAPVTVFLPGPLGAASGKLDAKLAITGFDENSKVRGRIEVVNARVPLAPTVGTLRDAHVVVDVSERGMVASLDGKLGGGSVSLRGQAGPDLRKIELEGALRKVSPIGEVEPVINADFTATLRREPKLVRADVQIKNASIVVPAKEGRELLDPDAPEDLYFTSKHQPLAATPRVRAQRGPWLIANVDIASTTLEAKEPFEVRARFRARDLIVSVGSDITMEGTIELERSTVDVFGRVYDIEPGPDKVRFDGTPEGTLDPQLALRLTHDFPSLSLVASIGGRVSKPELSMSSAPGGYSGEELFAFFLGGDPSGDRTAATSDAATGVGASYVSSVVGQRVKKVLPFKIDVFNCVPSTSAAGASCTVGRWITENWYVAYKRREPRRDENPDDLQVQYYFGKGWLFEGGGFGNRVSGDILWRRRW